MWGWLREFQEIRHANNVRKQELHDEAIRKSKVCESCEVLKLELAKERLEKSRLLDHILHPQIEHDETPAEAPAPMQPVAAARRWKHIQQDLEAADRAKAAAMKKFQEADEAARKAHPSDKDQKLVDQLENSLGIKSEA